VGQHSNEHLTTAQLSAYLDRELSKDELALCDAHLQSCSQCRAVLADLRLTSALLHRMPQVEVPRSFVLPSNLAVLPAAPVRSEARRLQPTRSQYVIKRSLRALSTLAAVVGLLFILFGAISALPHGGYATSGAVMAPSNNAAGRPSATQTILGNHNTPAEQATQAAQSPAQATRAAQTQHQPEPTATSSTPVEPQVPQINLPAALDLGQPEGRLSIGAALLVLGVLGVLLTRRSRREVGVP
jgi:anti-sigma factor RsiW